MQQTNGIQIVRNHGHCFYAISTAWYMYNLGVSTECHVIVCVLCIMYENAYIEQDYARKILLINQVIDPFAPISFISLINEANTLMTYATPQVSETTQQVQISDSYNQNCYSRLTHCVSPYWPIITLIFSWITILSRIQPITFFFLFSFFVVTIKTCVFRPPKIVRLLIQS